MPAKNLVQTVTIKASPKEVYRTLADPKVHARFTGMPAKMSQKPGGKFSHYGESLTGYVLELVPGKRIVLSWRESSWPEGHHSIAWFELQKVPTGTKLIFEQFGIPAQHFSDIADGWKEYYWDPLKAFLES